MGRTIIFRHFACGNFRRLENSRQTAKRTAEEFERNAAENTTMLGASMNALQELLNPEAAKSKEVQMQLKEGRYGKKKREGKANDDKGEQTSEVL